MEGNWKVAIFCWREKTLEKSKGVVEFVKHALSGERGGICSENPNWRLCGRNNAGLLLMCWNDEDITNLHVAYNCVLQK
ncbi:hypothetical protein TSUD_163890 [Trifolium subterraneum]|uniref:Uncharacterized protein n=1 Tax=Trifolium subterraneum TaxID=3900 RepID=A0A2Z6N1U1_TRISU|nr:hypothetical protein TSUD_163890 [Trifolium subterraneum]